MCVGKLSRYIDFESYFSSAIGASSRKLDRKQRKNPCVPHDFAQTTSYATGPKNRDADSMDEITLRGVSRSSQQDGSDRDGHKISDAIRVKRDIDVHSEHGHMAG